MHVVTVGAKQAVMDALLAAGHRVTVLYEAWEEFRAVEVRRRAAHSCAVDSLRSVESLWSALYQIGALDDGGVDAVVANSEVSVVSAAIVGKLLGARALDPAVALRCRDKAVQKAAWRAAGVPSARFVVLPDAGAFPCSIRSAVVEAGLKGPYFVKPTAGYGSRRVQRAHTVDDLVSVVAKTVAEDSSMRRLMVEEQIEGDEWHFDGVVIAGEIQTLCVSRYLTPVFETKLGKPVASVCFPPAANGALYEAAHALMRRALDALGHVQGVFHLEAFARPGTLDFVAGELAARVGGNAASEIIVRTVGVDPWAAAALSITGDEIPKVPVVPDKVFGIVSLPAAAGRVNQLRQQDLTSRAGVERIIGLMPFGATMPDMQETSSSCIGFALIQRPTFAACQATIEAVVDQVRKINGVSGKTNAAEGPELEAPAPRITAMG
jgi:biotin carboxylase